MLLTVIEVQLPPRDARRVVQASAGDLLRCQDLHGMTRCVLLSPPSLLALLWPLSNAPLAVDGLWMERAFCTLLTSILLVFLHSSTHRGVLPGPTTQTSTAIKSPPRFGRLPGSRWDASRIETLLPSHGPPGPGLFFPNRWAPSLFFLLVLARHKPAGLPSLVAMKQSLERGMPKTGASSPSGLTIRPHSLFSQLFPSPTAESHGNGLFAPRPSSSPITFFATSISPPIADDVARLTLPQPFIPDQLETPSIVDAECDIAGCEAEVVDCRRARAMVETVAKSGSGEAREKRIPGRPS